MPDANSLANQLQNLIDLGSTESAVTQLSAQTELDQLKQLAQLQRLQDQQAKRQAEQAEQAQAQASAQAESVRLIDQEFERLGLNETQQQLSLQSGEAAAVVRKRLNDQYNREANRDPSSDNALRLQAALQQFDVENEAYLQANPNAVDYRTLSQDRVKDLDSADSFLDVLGKGAATAVAGIPGLAGIAASALGAESLGQTLGGAASGIQDLAPTDIGSSAAQQEFANILAQAEDGSLSVSDAIRQGVSLLGDGDFTTDLLAQTAGAAAGGGLVRGAANAGGRALGRTAATTPATSVAGRVGQSAAQAAPAIGVGLGAGVDEDLTTEQARILAGTGVASAGLAGLTGAAGAQVAESALGNLGRRIGSAVSGGRIAPNPTNVSGSLNPVGAGGQLAAGARGVAGTAGAEAGQEFIEGAGESLGQFAQSNDAGVLETLASPEARRQAVTAGAVQAPLGAAIGGPLGGTSAVSEVRDQNNRANNIRDIANQQNAEFDLRQQQEQDGLAEIRAQAEAQDTAVDQDNALELNSLINEEQAARDAERQALLDAQQEEALRQERINSRRQQLTFTQELDPAEIAQLQAEQDNLPLLQRQPVAAQRTEAQTLETAMRDLQRQDYLVDLISQGDSDLEDTFRALYRNQLDSDPLGADATLEDTFISQLDFEALRNVGAGGADPVLQTRQIIQDAFSNTVASVPTLTNPDTQVPTNVGDITSVQAADEIQQERVRAAQGSASADAARQATLPTFDAQRSQSDETISAQAEQAGELRESRAVASAEAQQARESTLDTLGVEVDSGAPTDLNETPEGLNVNNFFEPADSRAPNGDPQFQLNNNPRLERFKNNKSRTNDPDRGQSILDELPAGVRLSTVNRTKFARVRQRLNDPKPYTAAEANQILADVSAIEADVAAKKPDAPDAGAATTARQSRIAPPSNVRRTQGSIGTNRAPSASGLLPSVAEAPRSSQSFTQSDVEFQVRQATAAWKKSPNVQVVATTSDLPTNLQPTGGEQIAGVTDGNTAYIVADQITSIEQTNSVLQEELFHRGLSKSLGNNYDVDLGKVFKKRGGARGILELGRRFGTDRQFLANYQDVIAEAQAGNKEAQLELTDEVLARVAQAPNLPTGVRADIRNVAAKIKRYLRQFLPDAWFDTVSDADILLMVREANAAGREPGQVDGPVRVRQSRSKFDSGQNFIGRNEAGEDVIFDSPGVELNQQIPDPIQERITAQAQLTADYFKGYAKTPVHNKLGQKIFNHPIYRGIKKRLVDAAEALSLIDNEFKLTTPEQLQEIGAELDALTEVPSMLKGFLPQNLEQLKSTFSPHAARTRYMAVADYAAKLDLKVNTDGDTMYQVMERMNEAWQAYADLKGLNPTDAKQQISRYLNFLHAKERNDILWLKNGDLPPEIAATRNKLFEDAADQSSSVTYEQALADAAELMETHALTDRADFVASGYTDAQAAQGLADMRRDEQGAALLDQAAQATYAVIQASNEVKKQTGSYSNSFDNAIRAYGWENYIPLRGRGVDPDSDDPVFVVHQASNVLNDTIRVAGGRESVAEDIFDTVQRTAVAATEEWAFSSEYAPKVAVNMLAANESSRYAAAFQADSTNASLLKGTVQQLDINSPAFKRIMQQKDPNRVVVYNSANNGSTIQTALVLSLDSQAGADAVMGARSAAADTLEATLSQYARPLKTATQTLASLKTWRNPPFILFEALRNALTLSYVSAQEGGFQGFRNYVHAFTQPGPGNYLKDITRYTLMYGTGKFDQLRSEVAKAGPNSTLAELDEFFRLGGPTSQIAALADVSPADIEKLTSLSSGKRKGIRKIKDFDEFLGSLNVATDTMSRFALYKSLQADGVPKDVAAARAKNVANFEQRGTLSGPLSYFLEFAKSTPIGTFGLLDSSLTGRYGKETAAAAFGIGFSMYLLANLIAGEDDDGEDELAKINGKLYNRNFVFHAFGQNLQLATGFGASAGMLSSGVHAARFALGHQSLDDTIDNVITSTVDQYQALPLSGISPVEDPVNFAVNSFTPAVFRPYFEMELNMTGLGIPVRSDYAGADSGDLTDAFEGRYNSEQEMYDTLTTHMRGLGLEVNPDNMKHIMRGYGAGITYLTEAVFENIKYLTRDEDYAYDKKAGLYITRNFLAPTFQQVPSDFYKHYNRVGGLKKLIGKLKDTGNVEEAAQIESSDFYRDNIDLYNSAQKQIDAINREFKPLLRAEDTSLAEARNAKEQRNEQRYRVFKDYLEDATG